MSSPVSLFAHGSPNACLLSATAQAPCLGFHARAGRPSRVGYCDPTPAAHPSWQGIPTRSCSADALTSCRRNPSVLTSFPHHFQRRFVTIAAGTCHAETTHPAQGRGTLDAWAAPFAAVTAKPADDCTGAGHRAGAQSGRDRGPAPGDACGHLLSGPAVATPPCADQPRRILPEAPGEPPYRTFTTGLLTPLLNPKVGVLPLS